MILIYARGEGLGHLTRVRAAIHTLGLEGPLTLVTDSPYATRVLPEAAMISAPPREQLPEVINRLRPRAIYIDAFPGGIDGELCDLRFSGPMYLFARILKWDAYRSAVPGMLPRFEKAYLLEPLAQDQFDEIAKISESISPLVLHDPAGSTLHGSFESNSKHLWLIVHSGPTAECIELIDYARDLAAAECVSPQFLFVGPHQLPGIRCVDSYPAARLFPLASRIVTACGFNSMRQTAAFASIHSFLPFPRRFDDQFLRAAFRRKNAGVCTLKRALPYAGFI